MVHFGTNLKFIRKKRRINQAQLSTMLNVKPNTISNYETGVSSPDFKRLEILMRFFEVPVHDLLYTDMTDEDKRKKEYPMPDNTPQEAEDPSAVYSKTEKGDKSFWIIMEQISQLREKLDEVHRILIPRVSDEPSPE